ncbi:MAG: hypothetical protein EOO89_25220, partial [Pedobacter sp.]
MKHFHFHLKSPAILMLIFCSLSLSCKKKKVEKIEDQTNPPAGTHEIYIAETNLAGYQIGTIGVRGVSLSKTEYDLELGGRKLKGIK